MPYGNYFSYLPTVPYETFDGSGRYKVVTDIFKRVRATLQAKTDKTIWYNYDVRDRELPEHIAYKYYGDAKYHWVILLMNDIRDPQWSWPLATDTFDDYIVKKYGSIEYATSNISHWETKELIAPVSGYGYEIGDVVLKAGIVANSDFQYAYAGKNWGASSIKSITLYDKEIEDNESKRKIVLLRRNLLQEFVDEFENLVVQKR